MKEIITEIREELARLETLKEELDQMTERDSLSVRRAQGSILHDFYNGCERIFRKIALAVNGGQGVGEDWHRSLLSRMTLDLEGVRPRVISAESASDLDEYLGFRHVFRNIYGFELCGDRLDHLVGKFERTLRRFKAEITAFLDFLEQMP